MSNSTTRFAINRGQRIAYCVDGNDGDSDRAAARLDEQQGVLGRLRSGPCCRRILLREY